MFGKKSKFVGGGGIHMGELVMHPGVKGTQVFMEGGELGCI